MENKNAKTEKGKTFTFPDGTIVDLSKGRVVDLGVSNDITLAVESANIDVESKPIPSKIKLNLEDNTSKSENEDKVVREKIISINGVRGVELREENVQEILTAVPHWMIRWGNTLFCTLIILLLAMAWLVQYPEVVSTKMTVINKYPEHEVRLEKKDQIAKLLVKEGQEVSAEEVLMIMENNANYKDLLLLQSILDTITLNSKTFYFPFYDLPMLSLGDLQAPFAKFEDSYLLYRSNKVSIDRAKEKMYAANSNTEITAIKGSSDVRLFRQLIDDYQKLKSSVQEWAEVNVVKSPIKGKVSQLELMSNQKTSLGQMVMKIIPANPPEYVAQLQIPLLNSGKVKPEQLVHLKLDNYPEMEFGMLQGAISKIEEDPTNKDIGYIAEVSLPTQLLTSHNKQIEFSNNLAGQGEVIIKKSRLLEQFFSSLSR